MTFTLVIVPRPNSVGPIYQKWGAFHSYAGVEKLQSTQGVFYIDETAWIFDTRRSLPILSRVIHHANEMEVPIFVFDLGEKDIRSRISAFPHTKQLQEFLQPDQS